MSPNFAEALLSYANAAPGSLDEPFVPPTEDEQRMYEENFPAVLRENRNLKRVSFVRAANPTIAPTSTRGTHQIWVNVFLWNPRTRTRGYQTTIIMDTGAGGGNYASVKFIRAVERTQYRGQNIISWRGRGILRAANPRGSNVAPMPIIGTVLLPLIFPPVDRVFRARIRVVEGPPFRLILGTAFLRHYSSTILLEGAGSFKPTPDSCRVPLLPAKLPTKPQR